MLYSSDHVVFPDAEAAQPGWIDIDGEWIVAAGVGAPPRSAEELDGLVTPGLVDVHAHGGGRANFGSADAAHIATVIDTHARAGTTSMVASLVTEAPARLMHQVSALRPFVEDGELLGIHLEGPWLSAHQAGAHGVDQLRQPESAEWVELLKAAGDTIVMVTVAPELPGALAMVSELRSAGVVVSVGHTAADAATTRAAIVAGARGATHLFNAMADMHHRDVGPVVPLMRDERVWLELIVDGAHLDPELVEFVFDTYPRRTVLISDAMAAAGAGDGDFLLGQAAVEVRQGVARVAGTQVLAGSTLTLNQAVRHSVSQGVPLLTALRAATQSPADYLGLSVVGRIRSGAHADLVVFDSGLNPQAVLRHGRWI